MDFQIAVTVENAKNLQEAEGILDGRKIGGLQFHLFYPP